MQSNADTMSVEVQGQIGNVPAGHEAFTVYYDYCFSFRECFFRRRLQPVNCLTLSGLGLDLGLMASGLIEIGLVASNIYSAHGIN